MTQPQQNPSKLTIAVCVLAALLGLTLCVQAIAGASRELKEDERMLAEAAALEDRSIEELEAERLLHETEQLEAEKARLIRESIALEERIIALNSLAPKMPLIETLVASTEGESKEFIGIAGGADAGIQKGFQFVIRRDKKFIARVVAYLVGDTATGCRIVLVKPGEQIKVGDWASTKLD